MVLTNPPFGKKSSVTIVNADGKTERQSLTVVRDDFWTSTSNKQLNFVQHVRTLLNAGDEVLEDIGSHGARTAWAQA